MSIKAIPPRPGFSPYWYARGTHLGIFIDRSTRTAERRFAKIQIKEWERQIEQGCYVDPRAPQRPVEAGPPMFIEAAVAYMQSGGSRQYLAPIIEAWQDKTL